MHRESNELEKEGSSDEKDLEDFLSPFVFNEGSARPIRCLDIETVMYGQLVGSERIPRRLNVKSRDVPEAPGIVAYMDVDSVLWNLPYLTLEENIYIYPNPNRGSNITGNHLYVSNGDQGRPRPMGTTPHCLFGRVKGDILVHAIFPSLSAHLPTSKDYLPDYILKIWYESVMLLALQRCLGLNRVQHFRPSIKNARDHDKNGVIGQLLQPKEALLVTTEIQAIIENDQDLKNYFGGLYFHAACKGIKGGTAIPYQNLRNPQELQAWKAMVKKRYAGVFGEEGMRTMQVDVAVEFMGSSLDVETYGPLRLLWRKEGCKRLLTGIKEKPRFFEWWLTDDIAGMSVGSRRREAVQVGVPPTDPSYAQTYQLDKNLICGGREHKMSRLAWMDMRWSQEKFREAWEVLMGGLEDGRMMSIGNRLEIRMGGGRFFKDNGLADLTDECEKVLHTPAEYLVAIPSLIISRYQAACLWIIRDGAQRVDDAIKGKEQPLDPGTEAFMRLLASLFRGFYRGMAFSYDRRHVFGSVGGLSRGSLGLANSISKFGWPHITSEQVVWLSCWALPASCRLREEEEDGLQGDTERASIVDDIIGEREMQDLMGGTSEIEVEAGIGLTLGVVAERIIGLLLQDMIFASAKFQDRGCISTWNLVSVRQAISPGRRKESHISSRRKVGSWRKIFRYLFPLPEALRSSYLNPHGWSEVKYFVAYASQVNLLLRHERHLLKDAVSKLDEELWTRFKDVDCVVRCYTKDRFARVTKRCLCIDLRD